jgi:hypothetical protein
MKIEHFNHYDCYLDFDPATGKVGEVAPGRTEEPVKGIGALIDATGVAILANGGAVRINVCGEEFALDSPSIFVKYIHLEDGTTSFEVADASKRTVVNYASWWINNVGVPGLGAGADEDEDFLGYVYFMSRNSDRICHLARKYSK